MAVISDAVGDLGIYQLVVLIFGNVVGILAPCLIFSTAFIFPEIDHWCKKPDYLESMNTSEWKKHAIPFDPQSSTFDLCHQYAVFQESNESYINRSDIIKCQAWEYDRSQFGFSGTEQWNLVCDNAWMMPFPQGLTVAGILVGSVVNGYLADRYGRRPIIAFTSILFALSHCLQAFIPHFWTFNASRFISGFGGSNLFFTMAFVVEIMPTKNRCLSMLCYSVFWGFGFMLLAGIAFVIPQWNYQVFAIGVIQASFLPLLWWFYESPRWLLSSGRFEEAEKTIRAIAKLNRTEGKTKLDIIIPELTMEYAMARDKATKEGRVIDLVNSATMFKYTVSSFIFMMLIFGVYYDLCLKSNTFPVSPYLNFVISGCIETTTGLLSMIVLRYFWRRTTVIVLCSLPTIIYVASIFFTNLDVWLTSSSFVISRFCIALTNDMDLAYLGEIFPTNLRASAVGVLTFASQLGGTIQPFIAPFLSDELGKPIAYAGCLLVCTLIPFLWRETYGSDLPDFIK